MSRLSIRATAIAAYEFTFKNYLSLLGITWAPTLLMIVIMLWQFAPFMAQMNQGILNHDQTEIYAGMKHVFLFEGSVFLLLPIIVVGVTRLALGLDTGGRFFYFSAGADFGRLLLAYFVLALMFFGVALLISIGLGIGVSVAAARLAGPNPTPAEMQMAMHRFMPILLIGIYAVMLFVFVRLAFLVPSIVVSEHRIGLGRNWTLTRGNFWRVTGLTIAIIVPILVLMGVQLLAMVLIGGPSLNYFASFSSQQAQLAWSQNMISLYATYWYLYLPMVILLGPIFNGPIFGASAFAYRVLVEGAPATLPIG